MKIRTLALVCIAGWLRAQDASAAIAANDLRGPAIGEVRDANGKPWTSAEVVLLSRPLPHDPNAGEVDRVVAKVDERGRFRASILRGRPYTVWAWGDANEKGRPASAVADRVFVQQPTVLKQERVLPARDIVLAHGERWEGFTFRVRVVDHTWNRDVHWLDVKDGRAHLPWLVAGSATVELFAVRAGVLHPLASVAAAAAADAVRVEVPEHRTVTCTVRNDANAPLADAEVFRCLGDVMHRVGTTDAKGTFVLDGGGGDAALAMTTLVRTADGGMSVFLPAGSEGAIASAKRAIFDNEAKAPEGASSGDLSCRVAAGRTVWARFLAGDDEPLANLEVRHAGTTTNRPTPASMACASWSTSLRTDANGLVQLHGIAEGAGIDAHALLRESDLAALPPAWRQGLVPVLFAPLVAATGKGTRDDPFVVALPRLCPIELTFVGPGTTPVAHVDVMLCTLAEKTATVWPQRTGCGALTDERGCIRLLVPAARHLGFVATAGMRRLVRGFETTDGHQGAPPATATFELPAPRGIRGRLRQANGDPANGNVVLTSLSAGTPALDWDYASQPRTELTAAKGNALRLLLPDDPFELGMLANLLGSGVACDADGRFELPLPRVALPRLYLVSLPANAQVAFDQKIVQWTGESIADFEWRLQR